MDSEATVFRVLGTMKTGGHERRLIVANGYYPLHGLKAGKEVNSRHGVDPPNAHFFVGI